MGAGKWRCNARGGGHGCLSVGADRLGYAALQCSAADHAVLCLECGAYSSLGRRASWQGHWRAAGSRLARRRSEEHTSELQSLMRISYAVFCLKKKKK